jgi:hypothetical protein
MNEKSLVRKSLTELILDEMFAQIEKREEFDTKTIQELKKLASKEQLHIASQVTKAIDSMAR